MTLNVRIPVQLFERERRFLDQAVRQSVQLLRPVERHDADRAALLDQDVLVAHVCESYTLKVSVVEATERQRQLDETRRIAKL
jgi:hypothetical protein